MTMLFLHDAREDPRRRFDRLDWYSDPSPMRPARRPGRRMGSVCPRQYISPEPRLLLEQGPYRRAVLPPCAEASLRRHAAARILPDSRLALLAPDLGRRNAIGGNQCKLLSSKSLLLGNWLQPQYGHAHRTKFIGIFVLLNNYASARYNDMRVVLLLEPRDALDEAPPS